MNDKDKEIKIIFWDRTPFEKHKKTVTGTVVKNAPQYFVIDIGTKAIIIPHRDVLHISELTE